MALATAGGVRSSVSDSQAHACSLPHGVRDVLDDYKKLVTNNKERMELFRRAECAICALSDRNNFH